MNRAVEIVGFLTQNGWDAATHTSFDADFSPRRYARLERANGQHAILMDADPDQKTPQFVMLAKLLRGIGLHAPEIYAAHPGQGLVLMEDFGDRNIGRLLDEGTAAQPLYRRAVDVLVQLHKNFDVAMARDIGLPHFDAALFATQAELFLDAYFPYVKERDATIDERNMLNAAWYAVLQNVGQLPQSLLLRDFMPDNLMDIAGQDGLAATGVLDFQDAGIGPIAYDLGSLCEVVRRDGGAVQMDDVITYYVEQAKPAIARDDLKRACIVLSAQRHMRILGILTRLVLKGHRDKLDYIPRVRNYLTALLRHEVLHPVAAWMTATHMDMG